MVLLIDIGNSAVKWIITPQDKFYPLVFQSIHLGKLNEIITNLKQLKDKYNFKKVIVSSVKPSLNTVLKNIFPEARFPTVNDLQNFIKIDYKSPKTLGIDRLFNAIGGLHYDKSFVIVSIGSATVVDLVIDKTFIGGVIFLGIENHINCLSVKTELLPKIKIENIPPSIGRTTTEAISSGVFWSHLYAIKGFINNFQQNYGVNRIILTGGLAFLFRKFFKTKIILDPYLTFRGIYKVAKVL